MPITFNFILFISINYAPNKYGNQPSPDKYKDNSSICKVKYNHFQKNMYSGLKITEIIYLCSPKMNNPAGAG
jgi:hypothetical protein